ncbi:uncharacterized protein PAN0_011d4315 [Moesziomyces antarcticus]|uniref:Uncharacterized protein n=1 Tax=Pseudozyma antarctica TaxID=84753 RepID=A0A081CHE7_PSEA2|nr:uncharacterized protein PAN0_011d4315 [Moesziomyces antarcticus]GAK66093.1 hypothetical protein PAN0_011d4315 [Moesziomyces antarcticus]
MRSHKVSVDSHSLLIAQQTRDQGAPGALEPTVAKSLIATELRQKWASSRYTRGPSAAGAAWAAWAPESEG